MSQQVNIYITNFEPSASGSGLLNRSDLGQPPLAPGHRTLGAAVRARDGELRPVSRAAGGARPAGERRAGVRPSAGRPDEVEVVPPRPGQPGQARDGIVQPLDTPVKPAKSRSVSESLSPSADIRGFRARHGWHAPHYVRSTRYALALTSDLTAGETMPAGRQRNNGAGGFPRRRCCRIMSTI
jgi:hypothetical protein